MSQGSVSGRATAIGLMAVVLWSAMVALVRTVTETFGAALGAAIDHFLPDVQSLPQAVRVLRSAL